MFDPATAPQELTFELAHLAQFQACSAAQGVLVLFDQRVQDLNLLSQALVPEAIARIIRPHEDALRIITHLLTITDIRRLAIVAHGEPGVVHLGARSLTLQQLQERSYLLGEWNLEEIALYSCNVAQDDWFIAELSRLTGATVVAATGKVGAVALGGNWELETVWGDRVSPSPFMPETLITYSGTLSTIPSSNNTDNLPDTVEDNVSNENDGNILLKDGCENDTLISCNKNDFINEEDRNNPLNSSTGDDVLFKNLSHDKLMSEIGSDTYILSVSNLLNADRIIELSNTEVDTVQTAFAVILSSNIENLTLTGTASFGENDSTLHNRIAGKVDNNHLGEREDGAIAGEAENDTLKGEDRNGVLTGRADHDSMNGGVNTDTVVFGGTNLGVVNIAGLDNNTTREYRINGGTSWTALTGGASLPLTEDGAQSVIGRQIDPADNTASSTLAFTLDTTAPGAGMLALNGVTDSDVSTSNRISQDNGADLSLSGNEPISSVVYEVSINGGIWNPTASTQTGLADSAYQFRARATDGASNADCSTAVGVTVDTTAPAAGTLALSGFTDDGPSDSDGISQNSNFDYHPLKQCYDCE